MKIRRKLANPATKKEKLAVRPDPGIIVIV
jgi:hypothetical protein